MKNFKLLVAFMALGFMVSFTSCKKKISDADLKTAITEKLATLTEASGLNVDVAEGVATISGECKDEACKMACETAIKAIAGVKSVVNNASITPPAPPAPTEPTVEVATDNALTQGVKDAVKDFAGVNADIKDGIVTLTGEIKRLDLPKLLMALNALKPKKVENQLTVK